MGERSGYEQIVAIPDASSLSGQGPGSTCILLLRVTGADTYGPGCKVSVPVNGRPLPGMGSEPELNHPISPAREQSCRTEQQAVV